MHKHAPKFDLDEWSNDPSLALLCPKCGGNNLHQYTVHTFHRGEDEDKVINTSAYMDGTEVKVVPNDETDNPSSRRHGLTIEFECENCHQTAGDSFRLNILQHKGCTYMVWHT